MDSDVVIIHVGTNDLKNSKPEELSTGILTALKKIQENNIHITIFNSTSWCLSAFPALATFLNAWLSKTFVMILTPQKIQIPAIADDTARAFRLETDSFQE